MRSIGLLSHSSSTVAKKVGFAVGSASCFDVGNRPVTARTIPMPIRMVAKDTCS